MAYQDFMVLFLWSQKHQLLFRQIPLKSANYPSPPFEAIPPTHWFFGNTPIKIGFFSEFSPSWATRLSQQLPSKNWGHVKPPFFEIRQESAPRLPPLPPKRNGWGERVHTMRQWLRKELRKTPWDAFMMVKVLKTNIFHPDVKHQCFH